MAGLNTPQPLPDFLVELGGGGTTGIVIEHATYFMGSKTLFFN